MKKENFDTETANGEMILSMICAAAQEESLSISQNTKWGIRKKMHDGHYITNLHRLGTKKSITSCCPMKKNNAMIVNDIFKSYLFEWLNEIAEHLNTIYPKENSKWNPWIHAILRNEKYIGDSLYQKNLHNGFPPIEKVS